MLKSWWIFYTQGESDVENITYFTYSFLYINFYFVFTDNQSWYAVIVAIMTEHGNMQISQFYFKITQREYNDGQISPVPKRKKHK